MPRKKDTRSPREIWAEEEKNKRLELKRSKPSPFDDDPEAEKIAINEEALKDDWEILRRGAKANVPYELVPNDMSPRKRLVAYAYAIGWPITDIAKASGLKYDTVHNWLTQPAVEAFIEDIQLHSGSKPVKAKLEKIQYKLLRLAENMAEDVMVSENTRATMIKFLWEAHHGKANQPIEHKGTDLRSVIERMNKAEQEGLIPGIDNLTKDSDDHTTH